MLQLELKLNSVPVELGYPINTFIGEYRLTRDPMSLDGFDSSIVSVRKLNWFSAHLAGSHKGETVHRITDCMVESLQDFALVPLESDSPFGSTHINIELFSAQGNIRKINISAISPKIMKLGLPCRAEIILNQFTECCTRSFGNPTTLPFSGNLQSGDDIFHVWSDDDSIIKCWCHNRKAFVSMWEVIPRTPQDPWLG